MSNVEKQLQEMLNEEKWTRAAISNYSIANFKELDQLIKSAKEEEKIQDIKIICDEHILHSKNSIIALYIVSIISLSQQALDDSSLVTLINIFIDNHKNQIVEHLCLKVLEFGESKFALHTLADLYKDLGNDEFYSILERLVKIDYDEAEIPKQLAEKYEEDGNFEKATDYYKKALHRYINLKQTGGIKEVWNKLVTLIPDDIYFFYSVYAKICSSIDNLKNSILIEDLYKYYKEKQNWKTAIDLLKMMLHYDDSDEKLRKELVECLRNEYSAHSQLEECIKDSDITQNWRPVFDALDDFEKHIAFDVGNFVFHRSWGVGRIKSISDDGLKIDFPKKRDHVMSLKMGITALQTLSKEHIWVLKSTNKRADLTKKVKEDPKWALRIIILSFGNNCNMKKVKQEIVPSLLTQTEWTSWNTKARKILKEDPTFGVNANDIDSFMVRERPISLDEKLANEFKAQKNFFARIDILNAYKESCDTDSDAFREMFNYFDGFLKTLTQVNEQMLAAYLLVNQILAEVPHLTSVNQYNFLDIYERLENPAAVYSEIKNKDLKKLYLNKIKMLVPNWHSEFIKLFPSVLSKDILDTLIEDDELEMVKNLAKDCFENYRVYKEAVIWFFKNAQEEEWFQNLGIDMEHQIIVLVHILDITFREIANRRNTVENRKINHQVYTLLFGNDKLLENFISESDTGTITRLYTLVADIKDLDPSCHAELRSRILSIHKDFKFLDIEEKEITSPGLIVTARMYEEKSRELKEIQDERIPRNTKDIEYALSLGDLRENAEYKAAKEEQSHLNNLVNKLQDEIERAQKFDPTTITGNKVFFGTEVQLLNKETNEKEQYVILGPWESDPMQGIISYMSPLGRSMLNKKKGESFSFEIDKGAKSYEILDITIADPKYL